MHASHRLHRCKISAFELNWIEFAAIFRDRFLKTTVEVCLRGYSGLASTLHHDYIKIPPLHEKCRLVAFFVISIIHSVSRNFRLQTGWAQNFTHVIFCLGPIPRMYHGYTTKPVMLQPLCIGMCWYEGKNSTQSINPCFSFLIWLTW